MRKIIMLSALVLSIGACGKKGGGAAIEKMESIKKDMCACKDSACVTKVSESMSKYTEEMAKDMQKNPPSADDAQKIGKITQEMTECATKIATAAAGAAAAPAPAATP